MSSDVISSIQLDKESSGNRVIVVKEICGCDSSFIITCALNHCIKNKKSVFVISTHNSFSHFQNVVLKMNCNLQRHMDSGLLDFYNLGEENLNNMFNDFCEPIEQVFVRLKEKILSMKNKHGTVNVILDGVSHLLDIKYTLRDVNYLCSNLIKIVRDFDNSFVLCHCNVASEDDVTHVIANLLCHKSETIVEVETLRSGLSAEVSGHLTVKHVGQKFEDEHMYRMDMKPSHYLFKLFDRGVKLLAPGTV